MRTRLLVIAGALIATCTALVAAATQPAAKAAAASMVVYKSAT
jgi:hypothetical protein